MKPNKKIILALMFFIICTGLFRVGMVVGAASNEPGSEGDPLITQSYLESRLKEMDGGSSTNTDTANVYKKVTVDKKKVVTIAAGGEIILFSGSGVVTGTNGLVNVSTGELFKEGNSATKYNIYLSPASSSGIKATSSVTIFVKGSYSLK